MATINMESILAKAQKCMVSNEMQRRLERKVDEVVFNFTAVSGGGVPPNPTDAAKRFIEVLTGEIQSSAGMSASSGELGATAVAALSQLTHGDPVKVGRNRYQISVSFTGNLHRESLYQRGYPSGVSNIAALLNAGYDADKRVYGTWHGDKIGSLQHRSGAQFIESAIRAFMANDAKNYGVINIEVDDAYK